MRVKIPKNLSVRQITKLTAYLVNMKEVLIKLGKQVDATSLEEELQADIKSIFKNLEKNIIIDIKNKKEDVDILHVKSVLKGLASSFDTVIFESYSAGHNKGCMDLGVDELSLTDNDSANIIVLKMHSTNVLSRVLQGLVDRLKEQLSASSTSELDIVGLQRLIRQQIDGIGLLADDLEYAKGIYTDIETLANYIARLYEKGIRSKNKLIKLLKQQLPTEIIALRLGWVKSFVYKVAKSIARTEVARAINHGRLIAYKKLNIEWVEISHPVNQRPCKACDKYKGKVYGIEDAMNLLPHHPFCSCTWVCVVEREK